MNARRFSRWLKCAAQDQRREVCAPPPWNYRTVARYLLLANASGLSPEERAERDALAVQVWHVITGDPVSRTYDPKHAFVH